MFTSAASLPYDVVVDVQVVSAHASADGNRMILNGLYNVGTKKNPKMVPVVINQNVNNDVAQEIVLGGILGQLGVFGDFPNATAGINAIADCKGQTFQCKLTHEEFTDPATGMLRMGTRMFFNPGQF